MLLLPLLSLAGLAYAALQVHVEENGTPTLAALLTQPTTVYRQRESDHDSSVLEWQPIDTVGPNIQDRHTLRELAKMSGDAYALPGNSNWYELSDQWNTSHPFGWEDSENGFRGHTFFSADNSTLVLAIKGTTLQGPTSKKDKYNDNLLFSCCCARVDFTWVFATVCDCYTKKWKCDSTCLSEALERDSLFYTTGVHLIQNLTQSYPDANIWLTGHSLGGALAALLGAKYGFPVVAFESPGERLAAERLGIDMPPSAPVTHVYHNADPIPQGTCTGLGSPCVHAGYAIETRCHLGKSIVYDTINKFGWRVDVRKHVIREIITAVLEDNGEWEEGRTVPLALEEEGCVDCFKWEFGDFKDKKLQLQE